jgi:DNA-binding ferritin-like protein
LISTVFLLHDIPTSRRFSCNEAVGVQVPLRAPECTDRARKIGRTTIHSIRHIARLRRVADNDAHYVTAKDMLSELHEDEKALVLSMRAVHTVCDDAGDEATAPLWRIGSINSRAGFASRLK